MKTKKTKKKKGIDAVVDAVMSKFPDNSSELQWKSRKKKAKKNKQTLNNPQLL